MNLRTRNAAIVLGIVGGLVAGDAAAWGPRAQRAIAIGAIQMIRREFPGSFKAKKNNYAEDVVRGAAAGAEVLAKSVPLTNQEEALTAVGTQIQMLREVRQFGMGSYFAFRMGVLAALLGDAVLPYGLVWSPTTMRLREQIESDIDAHLESYRFKPSREYRQYIRNMEEYFRARFRFYADDKKMIADDYTRGQGYDGFLRKAGQAYFGRAVEAVSDAWYTVLRPEGDASDVPPSSTVVARYFVDEIAYLLGEKRNIYQADKTYSSFAAVNFGLTELYEQVGDLYYGYGTQEARERGVREWRIAFSEGGTHRRSVASKLSNHYLRLGQEYFGKAEGAGASERDLPNARDAFMQALEFDRGSDIAAKLLNETNIAIAQREERRQMAIDIISSAEQVMRQADKHGVAKDFGNAIATYKKAITLFEAVTDEFDEQSNTAKESVKAINKSINDVVIEVLDTASEAISQGERLVDEQHWDDGVEMYKRVPDIVSVIPPELATHSRHKKEVLEIAVRKIEEAKAAKQRFVEAEKARKAAAAAAAAAAAQ